MRYFIIVVAMMTAITGHADPLQDGFETPPPSALLVWSETLVKAPPSAEMPRAKVTASNPIDASLLSDGSLARTVELAFVPKDGKSWIEYHYATPQTIRALTVAVKGIAAFPGQPAQNPRGQILASDDGNTYRAIGTLPREIRTPQQTIVLPTTTARYFRVEFEPAAAPPPPMGMHFPMQAPTAHTITELVGAKGIGYMVTDSYEAGAANWTDDILAQFQHRRGYDPTPWLPVLTGRVVQSAPASEAFLWDFRRTLSDLIAEAHYGTLSEALRLAAK